MMTDDHIESIVSRQTAEKFYEELKDSTARLFGEKATIFDDAQFRELAISQAQLYLESAEMRGVIRGAAKGLELASKIMSKY